jgi:DNA-binding MarR family transcriptional regulator
MVAKNAGATATAGAASDAVVRFADELRGLCAVITKIARLDHQRLLDRHRTGLRALEHGVLRRAANGAGTLAEVSELMSVAPSTLVYVIDRLVLKGLLGKKNDPRDRRRERLSVTPKGRSLLAAIPAIDSESAIARSLARMSQRQRTALEKHLRAFVAGLAGAAEWRPEFRPVAESESKHDAEPATARRRHPTRGRSREPSR